MAAKKIASKATTDSVVGDVIDDIFAMKPAISPVWWRPSENSPKQFRVRPLEGIELVEVRQYLYVKTSGAQDLNARGVEFILRSALLGWKGVTDSNGVHVDFSIDTALERFDPLALNMLAMHIFTLSQLSEEAEKK